MLKIRKKEFLVVEFVIITLLMISSYNLVSADIENPFKIMDSIIEIEEYRYKNMDFSGGLMVLNICKTETIALTSVSETLVELDRNVSFEVIEAYETLDITGNLTYYPISDLMIFRDESVNLYEEVDYLNFQYKQQVEKETGVITFSTIPYNADFLAVGAKFEEGYGLYVAIAHKFLLGNIGEKTDIFDSTTKNWQVGDYISTDSYSDYVVSKIEYTEDFQFWVVENNIIPQDLSEYTYIKKYENSTGLVTDYYRKAVSETYNTEDTLAIKSNLNDIIYSESSESNNQLKKVLLITIPILGSILIVTLAAFFYRRNKKMKINPKKVDPFENWEKTSYVINYCDKCGHKCDKESQFCPICGKKLL